MASYNRRKVQVLGFVAEWQATTSRDLSQALDLEVHLARVLLSKYHKQGLLKREKDEDERFYYTLTRKGKERLSYLRRHTLIAELM